MGLMVDAYIIYYDLLDKDSFDKIGKASISCEKGKLVSFNDVLDAATDEVCKRYGCNARLVDVKKIG